MRGVGILDMFMVLFAVFLLLALVIAVGLIGPTGATRFDVDVDDALLVFEYAQYGKPLHELLTIEQPTEGRNSLPDENRSIAESIDRNDGPNDVAPPQIAALDFVPRAIPNVEGVPRQFNIYLSSDPTGYIVPNRRSNVYWIVQFDEDTRYAISGSLDEDTRGEVLRYALE